MVNYLDAYWYYPSNVSIRRNQSWHIAGASGGLTVILSVLFLGERINPAQILSIIAILFGLALSSIDFQTISLKQIASDRGVPYALVTMITWGIYFTFVKIPINNIGWFWPAYFSWLGFPLVFVFMKMKNLKIEIPRGGVDYILFYHKQSLACHWSFCF